MPTKIPNSNESCQLLAVLSLVCIVWHAVHSVDIVARRRVRLPSCVLLFGEKFGASLLDLANHSASVSSSYWDFSTVAFVGSYAASTHSGSAASAVAAPPEVYTCQVVGSSLASSSNGFRYCDGSCCWSFRMVRVCFCERISVDARHLGRHSCITPWRDLSWHMDSCAHTLASLHPSR